MTVKLPRLLLTTKNRTQVNRSVKQIVQAAKAALVLPTIQTLPTPIVLLLPDPVMVLAVQTLITQILTALTANSFYFRVIYPLHTQGVFFYCRKLCLSQMTEAERTNPRITSRTSRTMLQPARSGDHTGEAKSNLYKLSGIGLLFTLAPFVVM